MEKTGRALRQKLRQRFEIANAANNDPGKGRIQRVDTEKINRKHNLLLEHENTYGVSAITQAFNRR